MQYREYLKRLEILSKVPANRELSDMELLELFLPPDNKQLYENVEAVLSVMARAALLISVESVVESWISVMEHHGSQRRSLGEMMLHEEMVILGSLIFLWVRVETMVTQHICACIILLNQIAQISIVFLFMSN